MLIENPDPQAIKVWGVLAYVSEKERKHILNLPFGGFKPAVRNIEKEIKAMEKKKKKAEKESQFKSIHRMPGENQSKG